MISLRLWEFIISYLIAVRIDRSWMQWNHREWKHNGWIYSSCSLCVPMCPMELKVSCLLRWIISGMKLSCIIVLKFLSITYTLERVLEWCSFNMLKFRRYQTRSQEIFVQVINSFLRFTLRVWKGIVVEVRAAGEWASKRGGERAERLFTSSMPPSRTNSHEIGKVKASVEFELQQNSLGVQ